MSVRLYFVSIIDRSCIENVIRYSKYQRGIFVLVDLKSVISQLQINIASERAIRRLDNASRIRDFGSLVMMYLSGRSQIDTALKSAGLNSWTEKAVLICEREGQFLDFLKEFGKNIEKIEDPPIPYDDPSKDRETFFAMSNVDYEI